MASTATSLLLIIALAITATKAIEHVEDFKTPNNRLLVVTIATQPNHEAFKRFNMSIEAYRIDLIVLGADLPQASRSDKIDLLRKAISVYKNEQDLVILVVNSSNLIINGDNNDILSRFSAKFKPETRIVFSTDISCWPDESLASKYPPAATSGTRSRFLSSDAFIGYAPSMWDLLDAGQRIASGADKTQATRYSKQSDRWQMYFTSTYLNAETRQKLAIELDHQAELFQNLHSIESDVEIEFDIDSVKLKNSAYSTEPVVVHETGPSKVILNSLGNYLGKAWTVRDGCRHCNETSISLTAAGRGLEPVAELPLVLVGLFIEEPTPFFQDFLTSFHKLDYPRNRMHLFIHSSVEYHDEQLRDFVNEHGSQYASKQVERVYKSMTDGGQANDTEEWRWRDYALEKCKQLQCDYYLALDSVARLDEPKTLRHLIEANRSIIAPLLSRPTKLWSNFWGSITADGYYARSHDYVELVRRERLGIWNVPQLMNAYLIEGSFIRKHSVETSGADSDTSSTWKLSYRAPPNLPRLKPILAFSHQLRSKDVFQFMSNTHEFGHLVDPTSYNISLTHPDFYQLKDNMLDWEQHYLHKNYSKLIEVDDEQQSGKETTAMSDSGNLIEQPCQDVFWFPLVSDLFCQHMIEIMETFGKWSGGTNDDPRIEGGYESVPTRDIHMRQVGLHDMWLLFLREYIMPIQLKEFIGYEHDPPRADLAFVVRYHPAEQASLRPHHDSSTYTLNIALNSPQVDYSGGGCRFVRYNCSVVESRKGWALLHPGRLTHYHEGLPVTNGTRYIMVTFVDP